MSLFMLSLYHVFGSPNACEGSLVGRWLKERKEKKKEETRAQNAQFPAAVSVAGVVTAIAAIAATTAASSGAGVDEQMAKTDMAVTSAATLVAAQCVEMAEAMGADCEHLASVVGSAANVRSAGGIMTLIVSVATLKARALKQVWNIAVAITVEAALDRKHNGPALLWKMISCIFIVVGSAPVEIL